MSSFYEKCKKWKYTIMVVQDLNGWVFGAYATERWHVSSFFYGTGETFLFTFQKGNKITVYPWTGQNDQIQWSNNEIVGVGGGSSGRFGFFLKDNFLNGSSSETNTFNNKELASNYDFICQNFEVWALE